MDTPLGNGIFVFVLGMLVIFLGMIIIVLAVSGFGKIFNRSKFDKKSTSVSQTQVVPNKSEEILEHHKVAIVAVISQYYFNEKSRCDFVVKKIKKI